MPDPLPRRRRPRPAGDPDRYLRRFGQTVQAWPIAQGHRVYLGSFPCAAAARRAIAEWRAGRLPPRPAGVRAVATRGGRAWRVDLVLPDGLRVTAVLEDLAAAAALAEDLRARGAVPPHRKGRSAPTSHATRSKRGECDMANPAG